MFCDAGVPNPDGSPSVYSTLTDLLIERGIARSEIGWVHDIADPNRRQPLWDQVRSGHTRILIGSTMQMGVGVNIQTRLYAAHELTAPYRPDWLEQAEGRLIRQGNHNPTVEVHRYVTERTADANSWQILQRKAHFIAQAMSDPEQMTRDLRDESVATVAEEFATIAAIATGDQRHIELAALTAATTRLERAERAHHASRDAQAPPDRRRRTQHRPAHRPDRRHRHAPPARRRPDPHRTTTAADALEPAHHPAARRRHLRRPPRPTASAWRSPAPASGPASPATGCTPATKDAASANGSSTSTTGSPPSRAERVELIERARRQIDAERARPVPAEFPRRSRAARDPATTRPAPRRPHAQARDRTSTTEPGAAAAGDDPTAPIVDGTAVARALHPGLR